MWFSGRDLRIQAATVSERTDKNCEIQITSLH